jgi:predicted nucleic acid-binding protein
VAIKWVVEEDDSDRARSLAKSALQAPDLLLTECANILWKKTVFADLTPGQAVARRQLLLTAPVTFTPAGELLDTALRLALDLKHPVYDCVFLALALRERIPLITADAKLAAVVRKKKTGIQVRLLSELSSPDTASKRSARRPDRSSL